jgi:hypothetical protein
MKMLTAFKSVCLGVITDEGGLGLIDLHQAVFLDLRERNVSLIPLQAASHLEHRVKKTCRNGSTDCCPPGVVTV